MQLYTCTNNISLFNSSQIFIGNGVNELIPGNHTCKISKVLLRATSAARYFQERGIFSCTRELTVPYVFSSANFATSPSSASSILNFTKKFTKKGRDIRAKSAGKRSCSSVDSRCTNAFTPTNVFTLTSRHPCVQLVTKRLHGKVM